MFVSWPSELSQETYLGVDRGVSCGIGLEFVGRTVLSGDGSTLIGQYFGINYISFVARYSRAIRSRAIPRLYLKWVKQAGVGVAVGLSLLSLHLVHLMNGEDLRRVIRVVITMN